MLLYSGVATIAFPSGSLSTQSYTGLTRQNNKNQTMS